MPGSPRARLVVNVALFQAGWFACVLGAAHGMPGLGVLATTAVVGLHLALAPRARPELALVAAAAAAGALFETLLVGTGWVRFEAGVLVSGLAPCWMVALWALFATTLNVSLRSLRQHPVAAALLGAFGAPATYYAGAGLGALEFTALASGLAAIAIGWAVLTPVLLGMARRFDGYAQA